MKKIIRNMGVALAVLGFTSLTVSAHCKGSKKETLVKIAKGNNKLSVFLAVVKAAGLEQTLNTEGPYIIFAPSNDAFAKLPKGALEALLKPENKAKLVHVLKGHVIKGEMREFGFKRNSVFKALNGRKLKITYAKSKIKTKLANLLRINGNRSIKGFKHKQKDGRIIKYFSIAGKNGVIYMIDNVITSDDISLN